MASGMNKTEYEKKRATRLIQARENTAKNEAYFKAREEKPYWWDESVVESIKAI